MCIRAYAVIAEVDGRGDDTCKVAVISGRSQGDDTCKVAGTNEGLSTEPTLTDPFLLLVEAGLDYNAAVCKYNGDLENLLLVEAIRKYRDALTRCGEDPKERIPRHYLLACIPKFTF
jgi:hypothetical protein